MENKHAELLHQLRSPIGALRSIAAMLLDGSYGELPEKAKNAVALIEHSSTRMLLTAESMLDESPSIRTRLDLKKEILFLVEELRVTATPKHLTLETAFDASVPETVLIDALALRNGVWNLVDNAIKYTDAGSIHVAVRAQEGKCVISVQDTGRGMSQEEISKPGTGLVVVRRLAEAAGGSVTLESAGEGKGSTALLTLQVEQRPDVIDI